jgi:hypothetical protein
MVEEFSWEAVEGLPQNRRELNSSSTGKIRQAQIEGIFTLNFR